MATVGGLDGLEGLVLETVVSKIGPKNAAALACANTRLRSAASDDAVWRHFCADDFDLSEPVDPDGNSLASFKETYKAWVESFKMYPLELVKRARSFWTSMRKWLAANFPEALTTLNRGASENQIELTERILGVKLPLPTRVLYRFCNGQLTQTSSKTIGFAHYGIIGGYKSYSHCVNIHLLPLEEIVTATKHLSRDLDVMELMNVVIVATSVNLRKLFFLDCSQGQLYVGTQNLVTHGELMPCVPESLVKLGEGADVLQDGLMVWLEEHLRRLQSGLIGTRVVLSKYNSISLFPEAPPLCSTAVTNGVKVRASAVLVPEGSNPGGHDGPDSNMYLFAYSIRLSLLPQGCMLDGAYYSSCQLRSRHWIIRSRGNLVTDLRGEAVIGQYPLLLPGKDEFVYESCTSTPAVPGSVEGSFTFVPGRLSKPEGREFEVRVALFVLEEPHFVF